MPRLSITLTESQSAALERIAQETGATKQSMIGLAVSAWIRANDFTEVSGKAAEKPEISVTVVRDGAEVAWLRGRWESDEHKAVLVTAHRFSREGQFQELTQVFRHELSEGESYRVEE